jgi:hypothetical protein
MLIAETGKRRVPYVPEPCRFNKQWQVLKALHCTISIIPTIIVKEVVVGHIAGLRRTSAAVNRRASQTLGAVQAQLVLDPVKPSVCSPTAIAIMRMSARMP